MFEVGNHIVEKNDKGQWIWKAKENGLPLSVKPKHNEKPEFPILETFEDKSKERYQKDLHNMVLDITSYLKTMVK